MFAKIPNFIRLPLPGATIRELQYYDINRMWLLSIRSHAISYKSKRAHESSFAHVFARHDMSNEHKWYWMGHWNVLRRDRPKTYTVVWKGKANIVSMGIGRGQGEALEPHGFW